MPTSSRRNVWFARGAWLVYAGVATVAYAQPIVQAWNDLRTTCINSDLCRGFQLGDGAARSLGRHGISLGEYAVFVAAVMSILWLATFGLAAVIMWRKPEDRGAVVTAIFLVTFPLAATGSWGYVPSSLPTAASFLLQIAPFLGLTLFIMLFPDGRFVPQWARWLVPGLAVIAAATAILANSWLWLFPTVVLPLIWVGIQVYRYRSVSSRIQRQQTKWALYGFVVTVLGNLVLAGVQTFTPGQYAGSLEYEGASLLLIADFLVVPVCITVAVLHSHLWDIDRIINLTLVYAALTVSLGAVYVGLVLGMESVAHLLVGGGSGLAVAVSTLATAALFRPFRGTIQTSIDRRFYRGRYDAQRTLASFSLRVRDQVDMTVLAEDLEGVVMGALHPDRVGWWLNETDSTTRRPWLIENGDHISREQPTAPVTVRMEQTSPAQGADQPLSD